MAKTLTICGANIGDIASFYAEINRVFMANEDWTLGHSLDALDDMLSGNYDATAGREPVKLIWQDIERSRSTLGFDATATLLRDKLRRPEVYDADLIGCQRHRHQRLTVCVLAQATGRSAGVRVGRRQPRAGAAGTR